MNKLMLASVALLLAGATALPAAAKDKEDRRGQQAQRQAELETTRGRGGDRGRDERRDDRRDESRDDRRDERVADVRPAHRDGRGGRGEGPRDWNLGRPDPRDFSGPPPRRDGHDGRGDNRRDWNGGRGDNRGDWNAGRGDNRRDWNDRRHDDRRDWNNGRGHDRRDDNRGWRGDRGYDRNHYVRHDDRRWSGHRWNTSYRYRAPVRYVYPRNYRPYHWQVGHRLPYGYYDRPYYVDYRAYRLPPPPYGHYWVRVDRDVVLVALASGLIRDIFYGLYY